MKIEIMVRFGQFCSEDFRTVKEVQDAGLKLAAAFIEDIKILWGRGIFPFNFRMVEVKDRHFDCLFEFQADCIVDKPPVSATATWESENVVAAVVGQFVLEKLQSQCRAELVETQGCNA